jgi:hypothetical protein
MPAYLRGVALSQQAEGRLAVIDGLVNENRGVPVYWGPGLELMNRIYGGVVSPDLPLWYHIGTTVQQADAPRLIEAIERSGAGLVVADRFAYYNFPIAVQIHLNSTWSVQQRDRIISWKRLPGR